MAYCAASTVAGFTKNILGGRPNFDNSSCPSIQEVNHWLSAGCAIIESTLAGCKYSVPVASGTTAYDWLANLNAQYAAAYVEWSRTNVTLGPGERTRGDRFLESFWEQLDRLCDGDMSLAGLTRATTGQLYVGGISISTKQTYEADSDRVKPRFQRGQFKFPGILDPEGSTASSP